MSAIDGGSSIGPFKLYTGVSFAAGVNQILIAAPGANLSIYLQTISVNSGGGAAGRCVFHETGGAGAFITELTAAGVNALGGVISFPGGVMIRTNQAVQVDVAGGPIDIFATYAIGPTL